MKQNKENKASTFAGNTTYEKLATFFNMLVFLGSIVVTFAWFSGFPILYTTTELVLSIFTAISLLILYCNDFGIYFDGFAFF
ncbi:MAG: hypothetical protein AAF518_13690 [Spirochaetota bacterium]